MNYPLVVISAIVTLGVIYVMFPVFMDAFLRYRQRKTVTCPNLNEEASVSIDAQTAALTSLTGKPKLHLRDCSFWRNEKDEDCDEGCLSQL